MVAIDRVRRSVNIRRENSFQSIEGRRSRTPEKIYAGNRQSRFVGATGGSVGRSRPKQTNQSIGEPVSSDEGQTNFVSGKDFQFELQRIFQAIRRVANRRGIQVFTGDPNDIGSPAYQDYDFQLLYDELNTLLYYWLPSGGATDGLWELINISGGGGPTIIYENRPPDYDLVDPINNPPPHSPSDGDIWIDTSLIALGIQPREWRYRQSTNLYYASGNIVFYGGDPTSGVGSIDPDSLIVNDSLYVPHPGDDIVWHYLWNGSDWIDASCCTGQPEDPPDDNPDDCPPGETWYDNGSPWGACTPV